jgi:hypothetical protein
LKTPITDMIADMAARGEPIAAIIAASRAVETSRRSTAVAPTQGRGTRLPDDWQPSAPCIAYALDHGMGRDRVMTEAERFRNYWIAKSRREAIKRDWGATWRNWVLKALEYYRNGNTSQNGRANPTARLSPTGADAIISGMGRLARRIDERRASARPGNGQAANVANAPAQLDFRGGRT